MIFLVPIALLALFLIPHADSNKSEEDSEPLNPLGFGGETMSSSRLFNLKDVSPENQGGDYKTSYDVYFEAAADEFGVPFALLKAHAIQESSINPKAKLDENPSKREDRIGWMSRGLMQLLWADDISNDKAIATKKLYDRFILFGYSGDFLAQSKGEILYDPTVNTRIAAQLIRQNLKSCGGKLRDAINMYNTGVKESVRAAPGNYVDRVMGFYNTILGA